MIRRILLSILLLTGGCSASGPTYSSLGLNQAATRVVVYREANFINGGARYWIELNGIEICRLHQDSFVIQNVQPGTINIASSNFGSFGTSRMTTHLKVGQTVYIKMAMNGSRATAGVLGGAIASAVSEGVEDSSGPVFLGEVSKQVATQEMATMKQDCE